MIKVYIAGPYSHGSVTANLRNAIETADKLSKEGFAPFIPHLNHMWEVLYHKPYEFWMELDFEWLKVCDALLRIPGHSPGADREIEFAKQNSIPVFYNITELNIWKTSV